MLLRARVRRALGAAVLPVARARSLAAFRHPPDGELDHGPSLEQGGTPRTPARRESALPEYTGRGGNKEASPSVLEEPGGAGALSRLRQSAVVGSYLDEHGPSMDGEFLRA